MDTTAQRIILNARGILVDNLVWGLSFNGRSEPAISSQHGLSSDQAQAVIDIASALFRLVEDDPAPPECQNCATPLVQPATGRPRRFCSDACRSSDYRARGGALASERAWPGLSQHARLVIESAGLTVENYVGHHSHDAAWHGDECGCTDDRCIGFHHAEDQSCGCLPVLIEEVLDQVFDGGVDAG